MSSYFLCYLPVCAILVASSFTIAQDQAPRNQDQTCVVRASDGVNRQTFDKSLPTIGILIFQDVLMTEVTAPIDVFSKTSADGEKMFNVITISATIEPVSTESGLRIVPDYTIADCPRLDVLVVPSAFDMTEIVKQDSLVEFIKQQNENSQFTMSNCAGAHLIGQSGIADGRKIVTYIGGGDDLRKKYPKLSVQDDSTVTIVKDGKFLSSNGNLASYVSALELLETMTSKKHREHVEDCLYLSRLKDWKQKPFAAQGKVVSELDNAIWHVFRASNNDLWFGSHEQGVYRYDGKTLVNFTTKDGLPSVGIGGFQEDKDGNIFITSDGVSKFDGTTFTTLTVSSDTAPTDWILQPNDLWFPGPQDSGSVYRYDGESLHRLEFPKTKAGDKHFKEVPRDKFPNAKYSPYDVYTIFKDSNGNLWFGTATLGDCRYDGKSFAWLSEDELQLGSFGTRSIVEDKDGKFWFCNVRHRYEVDLRNNAEPRIKALEGIRNANDLTKTPFEGVMSGVLDNEGAIWMATYGEGVWRYDGTSVTHIPVTEDGSAINLFSIYKDNQGVMWLGTQGHGAFKFNGTAFEKFRLQAQKLDSR